MDIPVLGWITLGLTLAGVPAWLATKHPRIFVDHIVTPAVVVLAVVLVVFGIGNMGMQCGMRTMEPTYGDPHYDEAHAKITDYMLVGSITTGILVAVTLYLLALRWLALKILEDQRTTTTTTTTTRRRPRQ